MGAGLGVPPARGVLGGACPAGGRRGGGLVFGLSGFFLLSGSLDMTPFFPQDLLEANSVKNLHQLYRIAGTLQKKSLKTRGNPVLGPVDEVRQGDIQLEIILNFAR
ncbi:hypothetical protein [Nitrospina gracilis]|uniref:hypothetical protein n=1 Tax=Nitrospina gracilis TaxID=35801 RepID=UPI001F26224F|nr:hypothetical protein [Nitrospina gracilis]MCF8721114.1 hypothetical protein [Nitrospina gracilis Nb-211]